MINYDEFDTEGMDDLGKASVDYVQGRMNEDFGHIFGDDPNETGAFSPTHLLVDVEWYEADYETGVYPLLIAEPIEDMPNNLVCLCPPFNKEKYL